MSELRLTPAAIGALAKGDFANMMVAATPGGIEAQEAAGQAEAVTKTLIPKDMRLGPREGCAERAMGEFLRLGFKFHGDHDDIFYKAELPPGWTMKPTDHSMWSKIVDDKGRERMSMFYKAAFYDRNSHIDFTRRYTLDMEYEGNSFDKALRIHIKDAGKIIDTIEAPEGVGDGWNWQNSVIDPIFRERYPNQTFDNPVAYWED